MKRGGKKPLLVAFDSLVSAMSEAGLPLNFSIISPIYVFMLDVVGFLPFITHMF